MTAARTIHGAGAAGHDVAPMAGDVREAFLEALRTGGRSPRTLSLYRWALARFAAWAEGYPEAPWSPELVGAYLAWCRTAGAEYDRHGRRRGPAASAETVARIVRRYLDWLGGAEGPVAAGVVRDGLEDFAAWVRARGRSEHSVRLYRLAVRSFRSWFVATQARPFRPGGWTAEDVLRFRSQLVAERRRPGGINAYLTGMRVYAKFLRSTSAPAFDPFAAIEELTLPRPPAQPRWLEPDEQHALVREITNAVERGRGRQALRDLALVLVMLDAGLREEQVAQLRPGDVVLSPRAQARIAVPYGRQRKSHGVPVESSRLHDALRRYDSRQRQDRAFFFTSQRAAALSTRGMRLLVRRWGERADVGNVTPQRLRHSFARNLYLAGVPLEQIARLLGLLGRDGTPNLGSVAVYTVGAEGDLRNALKAALR